MQTAFYEIVFYLNKQPHSHKLQTKMRSGLFSIHFTSQGGICKYNGGGGERVWKGGNWIKDSVRRDADYEAEMGRGRRTARGEQRKVLCKKKQQAEKRWLPWAECHPAHRYLTEREKPLQYPPPHHHHHHHSNSQSTAPLVQYSFEHVKYH